MAKVDVQDASEETNQATAPVESSVPTEASVPVTETQPVSEQSGKKFNVAMPRMTKRTVLEAVLVLAVVVLGVWAWMLYNDKQDLTDQLAQVNANPQIAVEQQTKELLTKVGQIYSGLPTNETPTIAAVSDAAKARKQSAFFANAQNGDKVLMYVKAGQAILYRPSTNKIVIVAPLTFSKATTDKSSNNTSDTTSQQ
jgi:hypothetical protein